MARISTGTMTVGIFAVLFGLVGAYALRAALVGEAPPAPTPPRSVPVPLAANDLPAGRVITQGDMVLVPMTQADMESRKLPLETTMLTPEQIVGRVLNEPLTKGNAFLTTNLYAEGTGPKLEDKLKPGMRAVTIPINNLDAVGGRTVEGSFVDVLFKAKERPANLAAGRPEIPSTTVTLLENVEVLSVGRSAPVSRNAGDALDVRLTNGRDAQLPSGIVSVTIAVTPDQANIIKAATGQGEMSLSLRANVDDAASATPNKYTLEGILGVSTSSHGMDRIDIFRGGWGRQTAYYQNAHLVKNETSIIPGIAPATPFPVPAVVPAPKVEKSEDPSTRPSPNFYYNGNGYGMGGAGLGWGGWGWGGSGVGAWGAGGTGATYDPGY